MDRTRNIEVRKLVVRKYAESDYAHTDYLAADMDASPSLVYTYRAGYVPRSFIHYMRMCELLGIDPHEVLALVDKERKC